MMAPPAIACPLTIATVGLGRVHNANTPSSGPPPRLPTISPLSLARRSTPPLKNLPLPATITARTAASARAASHCSASARLNSRLIAFAGGRFRASIRTPSPISLASTSIFYSLLDSSILIKPRVSKLYAAQHAEPASVALLDRLGKRKVGVTRHHREESASARGKLQQARQRVAHRHDI